jgi:Protein of unknown function (DUF3435)
MTLRTSSMCYSYFLLLALGFHPGSSCADWEGLRSFGSTGKEHPKLIYNCTAYFLAMAVADNALFRIESLEELQKLEIPAGEEELSLSFKESALDGPILRKCS